VSTFPAAVFNNPRGPARRHEANPFPAIWRTTSIVPLTPAIAADRQGVDIGYDPCDKIPQERVTRMPARRAHRRSDRFLIPIISSIPSIIIPFDVARNFGKGSLFGLGLVFLPFIFYPVLGFGDATYGGPSR
jgi:hypothetical protein